MTLPCIRFALGVHSRYSDGVQGGCEKAANAFQSIISKGLPKEQEHQNYVPPARLSEVWHDKSSTLALGEGSATIDYYRHKAEENDPDAAFYMGMISLHGERLGGWEKNFSLAVTYLEQALKLGKDEAHSELCMIYLHGYGTVKDVTRGRDHCLSAITNGHTQAHNQLAMMYLQGGMIASEGDFTNAHLDLTKEDFVDAAATHGGYCPPQTYVDVLRAAYQCPVSYDTHNPEHVNKKLAFLHMQKAAANEYAGMCAINSSSSSVNC